MVDTTPLKVLNKDPEAVRAARLLLKVFPEVSEVGIQRIDPGRYIHVIADLRPSPHCPTCGDQKEVVGLTTKCRDWHEVCRCGARYDQPKNAGCRRRKHPKEEA